MLELMAHAAMRVSEVLKIRPKDIDERKITLPGPKSGKESEVVFVPQKVAELLKESIRENEIQPDKRIFPITYAAALGIRVS